MCGKGRVRGVVIHCASLFESLFVTLVFEIMNIHCLIQVTQAPAPSGYFEVSNPAVFLLNMKMFT